MIEIIKRTAENLNNSECPNGVYSFYKFPTGNGKQPKFLFTSGMPFESHLSWSKSCFSLTYSKRYTLFSI